MIISSYELKNYYIPPDFKFELFDLKNKILFRNHPYQHLIFILYKYCYGDFIPDPENDEEYDDDDYDELFKKHFKLLDRYYRYGITFEDDEIYDKNKLYLCKSDYEEYPSIIRNRYIYRQLVYNNVKLIKIDELDKGEKNISEIEKWKRKVIINKGDRRTKLNLLDPYIYNSLITFVAFSNFKERPHNRVEEYFEYGGIEKVNIYYNYKCKYKNMKIYEDRIYNKIKKFLKLV